MINFILFYRQKNLKKYLMHQLQIGLCLHIAVDLYKFM